MAVGTTTDGHNLDQAALHIHRRLSRWIEPRLTVNGAPDGSRIKYFVGLWLMFGPDEFYQFGFKDGHRLVSLTDQDDNQIGKLWVGDDFHGGPQTLRIRRQGDTFFFESTGSVEGLFCGLARWIFRLLGIVWSGFQAPQCPSGAFTRIEALNSSSTLERVGLIVRTRQGDELFVSGAFNDVVLSDGTSQWPLSTDSPPPSTASLADPSLAVGVLLDDAPPIRRAPTPGP